MWSLRPRPAGVPTDLSSVLTSPSSAPEAPVSSSRPPSRRVLFPYLPDCLSLDASSGYFNGSSIRAAVLAAQPVREAVRVDPGSGDPVLGEALFRLLEVQEGLSRDVMTAVRVNRTSFPDEKVRRRFLGTLLLSVEGVLSSCASDLRRLITDRVEHLPPCGGGASWATEGACLSYRDEFVWEEEEEEEESDCDEERNGDVSSSEF